MRENNTDSVQNRFTAYLVASVTNRKGKYLERKNKLQEVEYVHMDLLEKNYTGFEAQFQTYLSEQSAANYEEWDKLQGVLSMIESDKLLNIIGRLKERDRKLLFARVFGELTFAELGEKLDMTPKQAEMAYFYVVRKIRKMMEDKKDEI